MASTAITAASVRARDPDNTATPRANVRDLLSRMQTILNAVTSGITRTTPITILARQQAYRISDVLPDCCKIIGVRDGTRDLDPIMFEQLHWLNQRWWTEVGDSLRSYALVGRDLLIVRPGLRSTHSINVVYRPITSALVTDNSMFQIPDEDVPLLLDPVEAMLDLKARDLTDVKPILERWMARLKTVQEERWAREPLR